MANIVAILYSSDLSAIMSQQMESHQLKTWKEIATHLRVSVRTAQNWERDRGLPVRRIVGEKSQVRALAGELDAWWASQEQQPPVGLTTPPAMQPNPAATVLATSASLPRPPSIHTAHLAVCCLVYAALFVLDLFLEVSYQFGKYENLALRAAPVLAAWIAATSALGLLIGWRPVMQGRRGGFAALFAIFSVSALFAFGVLALASVVPGDRITVLQFPSQPAYAAYFKNVVFYFLPLATTVWLIPFHFVACLHQQFRDHGPSSALLLLDRRAASPSQADSINLPVGWLVLGVLVVGLASIIMTQDLLRHLVVGPYANLFTMLAIAKSAIYFALAMLCITWYSRALAAIRTASLPPLAS
jgi:hypothetical protein